ncbi:HD domain-containing protein [Luteirhabdus pelagi]|uniref:HD domain-containing protein n=1 Tax=Luteirhabdus pelagi TaxID=2792783 RepID=UPI0019399972|nr:HD domain-containing protein [Luteirhabdus pelagi]
MKHSSLIENTINFVKDALATAEGGHDWFHIERVFKNAKRILQEEQADEAIVLLGALLHDIADSKFYEGHESVGPRKARHFLEAENVSEASIQHIENIIRYVSFKGGNQESTFQSKELEIVQDADRLDALGAIGIARTFNYGGYKNRKLYDPSISPKLDMTPSEYKKSTAPTINHFYEKLMLLKDRMNTETGRRLAEQRHAFMETYLEQFYGEWNGER